MKRRALTVLALLFAAGFVALGMWQVERRAWKHALIAAVDARIHLVPTAAPGPARWPMISVDDDAYRHVRAQGRFRHDKQVLVKAVTDLGGGYWVITPLETPDFTVLVNRGFVPPEKRNAVARPKDMIAVTGLLRISEPGGGFLRSNDPVAGRWYSRDVAAIARTLGLRTVAPYFIDADARPGERGYPVGGLTVVRFPDNHLAYALTWFALAALCLFFIWRLWRPGWLRSNRDSR